MNPIRVLLVDDHTIFRQGTATALRTLGGGIEIVGEADNGITAVEMTRTLHPDVVLMDLSLPGQSGIEATRQIMQATPDVKVVILTFMDAEEHLVAALRAGARGYLLKSVSPEELWAHVRSAYMGEMPISGSMTMRLIYSLEQHHLLVQNTGTISLTARERELVRLVAAGKSNPEIAKALFVSISTVKLHLHHVLEKLNLQTRTQLIAVAASGRISDAP